MELSKKTTILFTPDQHRQLAELAARRRTSLGDLVREACVVTYGIADTDQRVSAVAALAALALPVGTPAELKRESVPDPVALLP